MKTTTSEVWTSPVESSGQTEAISKVLQGDSDSFRVLVELHAPAVLGLCRRLLGGNVHDAEDVTQETFLNAYRFLARLVDRERFQAWLYQIARSLCRERRRRRAVEQRALAGCREHLLQRQRVETPRFERQVFERQGFNEQGTTPDGSTGCLVGDALSELPEEERKVLDLRYFEGLSYRELSRRMKLTHSQVDHLIRRARGRLARRLAVRQQVESR